MNDLDKQDLLDLARTIKNNVIKIKGIQDLEENTQLILNDIFGCANFIIEIVENKPHKIEKMF